MDEKQYRNLENYLRGIVIFVNIYSKEYFNLCKRIRICQDKAHEAAMAALKI
jgi:hypothetical protein